MNGYLEFRKKMRGKDYLNVSSVGMSIGTLTDIKPVTIEVGYGNAKFPFTKFTSLIPLDNLREEDINKAKFLVYVKGGAETICYILGELYGDINDLYIESGEE